MTFDDAHDKATVILDEEEPLMWAKATEYMKDMHECVNNASDYNEDVMDDDKMLKDVGVDQASLESFQKKDGEKPDGWVAFIVKKLI